MHRDFELIPHTADLQLRAYGTTLADLFRHCLIGMFQAIGPQAEGCSYKNDRIVCPQLPISRALTMQSATKESLLVDFLSRALALSDIYNEAYLDVTISSMSEHEIHAQLRGIQIQGFQVVEIKAVTYHNLAIKKIDGHWQADIVFDI